jgi:hypothetical protein
MSVLVRLVLWLGALLGLTLWVGKTPEVTSQASSELVGLAMGALGLAAYIHQRFFKKN